MSLLIIRQDKNCIFFQFVAHPNVQQLLASIWYEGLPGFRQMNMILQVHMQNINMQKYAQYNCIFSCCCLICNLWQWWPVVSCTITIFFTIITLINFSIIIILAGSWGLSNRASFPHLLLLLHSMSMGKVLPGQYYMIRIYNPSKWGSPLSARVI